MQKSPSFLTMPLNCLSAARELSHSFTAQSAFLRTDIKFGWCKLLALNKAFMFGGC